MFLSPQGLKKECLLGGGGGVGAQSVSLTHRARERWAEKESRMAEIQVLCIYSQVKREDMHVLDEYLSISWWWGNAEWNGGAG